METIQSLVESSNPWKSLQGDAARLANKWNKTGLLEGLGEDVNKNNMALMLENQAKQLVVESSATGTNSYFTSGTSGENWAGIALPLVRKVFGQIAAKEFVSVQPMNLPSGLVFFLDFQYGTTKTPFTSGNSLYGNRNTGGDTPFSTPAPVGGLYGAGRFTYSTNQTSSTVTAAAASGTTLTLNSITTASWAQVNYDSSLSASIAAGEIKAVTVGTSSLPYADVVAVRGFVFSSSLYNGSNNLNAFAQWEALAGSVTLFVTGASGGNAGTTPTVFYNKATTDQYRGDFEDGSAFAVPNSLSTTSIGSAIPEINISMQSQAITAKN